MIFFYWFMQIAWSQCIFNGKICSENISPIWISYTVLLYVKYSASTDQEIRQETMQVTDANKISSNQQDSSLIKITLDTLECLMCKGKTWAI